MTARRRFALWLLLPVAVLAGAAAAGAAQGGALRTAPYVGSLAPDFALRTPDGRDVALSSLRGKVIVLSFWDCYADVCFTSVSVLDEMYRRYPREKFALVTLCYEVPPAMAKDNYKKLRETCGMGQLILLDDQKTVTELYEVRKAPTSFVIGADMTIWQKTTTVPELRSAELRDLVDSLVNAIR